MILDIDEVDATDLELLDRYVGALVGALATSADAYWGLVGDAAALVAPASAALVGAGGVESPRRRPRSAPSSAHLLVSYKPLARVSRRLCTGRQ